MRRTSSEHPTAWPSAEALVVGLGAGSIGWLAGAWIHLYVQSHGANGEVDDAFLRLPRL